MKLNTLTPRASWCRITNRASFPVRLAPYTPKLSVTASVPPVCAAAEDAKRSKKPLPS